MERRGPPPGVKRATANWRLQQRLRGDVHGRVVDAVPQLAPEDLEVEKLGEEGEQPEGGRDVRDPPLFTRMGCEETLFTAPAAGSAPIVGASRNSRGKSCSCESRLRVSM